MKNLILTLSLFIAHVATAGTNVLELTWAQPPGYTSQLYTATNLAGCWTPLVAATNPPTFIETTQSVAFFTVIVTPPTTINYSMAGIGDPTSVDAPAGATYVDKTNGDLWENQTGGTNGWVWLIAF